MGKSTSKNRIALTLAAMLTVATTPVFADGDITSNTTTTSVVSTDESTTTPPSLEPTESPTMTESPTESPSLEPTPTPVASEYPEPSTIPTQEPDQEDKLVQLSEKDIISINAARIQDLHSVVPAKVKCTIAVDLTSDVGLSTSLKDNPAEAANIFINGVAGEYAGIYSSDGQSILIQGSIDEGALLETISFTIGDYIVEYTGTAIVLPGVIKIPDFTQTSSSRFLYERIISYGLQSVVGVKEFTTEVEISEDAASCITVLHESTTTAGAYIVQGVTSTSSSLAIIPCTMKSYYSYNGILVRYDIDASIDLANLLAPEPTTQPEPTIEPTVEPSPEPTIEPEPTVEPSTEPSPEPTSTASSSSSKKKNNSSKNGTATAPTATSTVDTTSTLNAETTSTPSKGTLGSFSISKTVLNTAITSVTKDKSKPATRGDIAKVVAKVFTSSNPALINKAVNFTDIEDTEVLNAVVSLGSVWNGVDPHKFNPSQPMTNAQLVSLIYKIAGTPKVDPLYANQEKSWYTNAFNYCVSKGYITVDDRTLWNPKGVVTFLDLEELLKNI